MKTSQVTTGLAVAALALALVGTPAQAGTIVALPFPDNTTVDTHCTLREAIDAANTNLINPADCIWVGTPGVNDTILLNTGTYAIAATSNEDLNASGDFDITQPLTITGLSATDSIIDAQGHDRVFDVIGFGTTLTLNDLTVTGGHATNGALNSGAAGAKGGGIRAEGSLTLNRVVVTANSAGNGGSGANGSPAQNGGQGGDGGGVYSLSLMTVTDSVISLNAAGNGGAGGSASGPCTTVTTAGTGGFGGSGGGIAADNGGATITGSTITQNMAGVGGNGGCASTPGAGANAGLGGGISASSLSLTNSVVSDNQTRNGGKAAQDFDSANSGSSGRGGDGGGIFAYTGATISGSTISGNITGPGNGNAPGTTQTSPGTQGGDGGGALLKGTGSVVNSTFSDNHTSNGASSSTNFAGQGGNGGGLAVPDPDFFAGEGYAISNSTFSGNSTGAGGNSGTQPGEGGAGGAVFIGSNIFNVRTDSTLTGNTTGAGGNHTAGGTGGAGGRGGAIGVGETSTVDLTHLTIAANTTGNGGTGGTAGARSDGGAIGMSSPFNPSTVTVKNSILASNVPATCAVSNGTIADGAHNLVFGTQCTAITAFSTADPLLGALADNGGPTQTRAIADTSPARDAVPVTGADCTAADQRGTTRPQGTACDAGAYEIFVPPPDTGGGGGGGTTPTGTTPTDTTPTTIQQPTGTAADVTKPRITVRIPKQTLRRIIKKGFACTFSTDEAGAATARLGKFGAVRFTVKTAGKQRCVIKLSKKTKRKLAKLKTLKVTVTVTVTDAARNVGRASKKLTLKR